jgi:hypothetical protein
VEEASRIPQGIFGCSENRDASHGIVVKMRTAILKQQKSEND